MDVNIFSNAQVENENTILDIKNTTLVAQMLYELKGGNVNNDNNIYNNQERLIQIDKYYLLKYKAQSDILKTIIFFCFLGLVGAVLYNKNLISSSIYNIYLGSIFALLIILISKNTYNIFLRDNINFDEYDYGFLYKPPATALTMNKNTNLVELSNMPTCGS